MHSLPPNCKDLAYVAIWMIFIVPRSHCNYRSAIIKSRFTTQETPSEHNIHDLILTLRSSSGGHVILLSLTSTMKSRCLSVENGTEFSAPPKYSHVRLSPQKTPPPPSPLPPNAPHIGPRCSINHPMAHSSPPPSPCALEYVLLNDVEEPRGGSLLCYVRKEKNSIRCEYINILKPPPG